MTIPNTHYLIPDSKGRLMGYWILDIHLRQNTSSPSLP